MHMFGHQHIAEHKETMSLSQRLEDFEKRNSRLVVAEIWQPVVTTERQKVVVTFTLISLQMARYESKVDRDERVDL
jgi:hypothetical protein